MTEEALFIYSGGNREGNYLRSFFFLFFFVSSRKDKMRSWLGTATAGQKGQTRGRPSGREADVRQEAKDVASCFFYWPVATERGQPEGSTVEGIRGGRKHAVREEEQADTGGAVVAFQFTPPLPRESYWYSVWLIWEINFCDLKFVG